MKRWLWLNSPALYLEIGQSSLKALDGEDGLELSLDRSENGRLTALCAERLTLSLRVFLKKHNWRPRPRAFCALGARGVSLRRLTLPAGSKEELQRLLPLQIEREFPLAPDELAWGWLQLPPERPPGNGPAGQELLVAAVKKEVLQEYEEILAGCGLTPVFTLAALARGSLCSQPPNAFALLDIGRSHSELISFDQGGPTSIRVLPWGGESLTNALEKGLAISHAEAEKLKLHLDERPLSDGDVGPKIQAVLGAELHSLARSLQPNWIGQRLYLSGASARLKDLAPQLAKALGGGADCARLETMPGEGRSAAILGLKRACERNGVCPLLILQHKTSRETETSARPAPWMWAGLAFFLLFVSLSLRYGEAIFLKPRLVGRISEIKAYRAKLPNLERDLSFLQYLKTNQPPYLDPLFALATSAPAGTRIESLSMNNRGDLSLRASMRDSQQVVDLRSKLIDSGLFTTVVVEEQTPTPDRQKVVVRITGQWKLGASESARMGAATTNVVMKATNAPSKMTNDQFPMTKETPMTNSQ